MKNPNIPIAHEGYPFIFFSAFVTLILAILGCATGASIALLAVAFTLWFFRDPERIVPLDADAIISPADGKIISMGKVRDERFAAEEMMKVSVFMNVFNVHVNRSPIRGVVENVQLQPGRFFAADNQKAVLHNEYCAMSLRSDRGSRITVVQVAGLIARRILCWAESGDRLAPGQRYGLIRFGSRVDLYLPLTVRFAVQTGQQVRAGETILGFFPAET